ncbi:RNA 2'-phosphotransferase [Paenisporosarcina indica]|uniref:RNA 2'-phosphotransferase n=1 Tax=Paenisporosarcina indica TaxID=650093 RepID=UPI00094FA756|nr:RNA 2'-phosphotransferase [Paenisporosarcina indica]
MKDEKLSKKISYALRHAPWEFGLELDNQGWVKLQFLLEALNKNKDFSKVTEDQILKLIRISDKKRFEVLDGKIRAIYGHSISQKIQRVASEPPEFLFHGTTNNNVESIFKNGLNPILRQYVHLSPEVETAFQVGKRRDISPVILKIRAKEAFIAGIHFYYCNDKVWISNSIPTNYIELLNCN